MRKQYPPLTLLQLQTMIDTSRIDPDEPIDLANICNTGLYTFRPDEHMYGINLTDEVSNKCLQMNNFLGANIILQFLLLLLLL